MDRETVIRLAREAGLRTGGNGNYGVSHITELERFAAAVEANCVPPGWKVVPIEPTDEMVRAGWDVEELVIPERMYYAMLAAAPAPKEES